jgi:hypothetical protein
MSTLKNQDPEVYITIKNELERQRYYLELIASENIVSEAVLEAQGSIFTNKYIMAAVIMQTLSKTWPLTGPRNCFRPNTQMSRLIPAARRTWLSILRH